LIKCILLDEISEITVIYLIMCETFFFIIR